MSAKSAPIVLHDSRTACSSGLWQRSPVCGSPYQVFGLGRWDSVWRVQDAPASMIASMSDMTSVGCEFKQTKAHFIAVHLEDLKAAGGVRPQQLHLPVEPASTQQRRIQQVRPVAQA